MSLIEAWRKIALTPPGYEMWVDRARALQILRCHPDELDALAEAGLAMSQDGRYERYDVWNTGMAEGRQRSQGEREMMFFNRLLRSHGSDWVTPHEYSITAVAECDEGTDCTSDEWKTPATPNVTWTGYQPAPGRAEWSGRTVLEGRSASVLSPVVRQIWDHFMADYRFQFARMLLACDKEQTRLRMAGDCTALSLVLADNLVDAGYEAVVESGYIFGGARTRWHRWIRFRDDDSQYKHLDVSMAMLADQYFTPDYKDFCFGSMLNRIIPVRADDDFYTEHTCGAKVQRPYVAIALRAS